MSELKPCPFCGGEAKITIYHQGIRLKVEIKCKLCGAMRKQSFMRFADDKDKCVELCSKTWNTREGGEVNERKL